MPKAKPHYGWLICLCGILLMFYNSGLVVNAFQVYMPYISEVNGFTDLQVSLIPTLRNLFSIFAKVFTAFILKNSASAAALRWPPSLSRWPLSFTASAQAAS